MNLLFESQKEQGPVRVLVFPELALEIPKDMLERADGVAVRRESDTVAEERSASLTVQQEAAQAREEGRLEGLAEGEQRRREDSEIERSAVAHLCTGFAKERKRYFAEIENEVVKLALAIAARVLQRESAMDATLLKGVVKVALTKLGDVKGAVLRLHPQDEDAWCDVMKHSGLEVMSDASLEMGELRLEAAGGVAELGIAAQLIEIERGFFDLLARRPA